MEERELTEKIIGCAMRVHSTLGPGFLESVYKKALAFELHNAGLGIEVETPVNGWSLNGRRVLIGPRQD